MDGKSIGAIAGTVVGGAGGLVVAGPPGAAAGGAAGAAAGGAIGHWYDTSAAEASAEIESGAAGESQDE